MFYDDNNILRLGRLIARGGYNGLTELEFFARELNEWKTSRARRAQFQGEAYYRGRQDILFRKRTVIGASGEPEEITNVPNNHIVDNQYALMVDQKTNYLVGKPFTVSCESKAYRKALEAVFNRRFRRTLKKVAADALKCGICWVYPYYNKRGELAFRRFPAYQILPFWADDDHTELDAALRLYRQEVYDGRTKKQVERVELYKPDGLWRYVIVDGELVPDAELGEHENYLDIETEDGEQAYNWERIPLIPFRYNDQELPLLSRVKSLQDGINAILSDFENNMQEDPRNTILILKNYDGEHLSEFRHNLAALGVVKVRSDGGVETLRVEVNSENYKAILDIFKKALIENARGYNAKDDRMSGNPNQMNIQSMYSDIDLDANGMETEFQAAFEDLLFFINAHLANNGVGRFEEEDVEIVFNRDILINESEAISNCRDSVGLLSEQTLVEQHPWVKNADTELKRLKKEREAERDKYPGAFGHDHGEDDE